MNDFITINDRKIGSNFPPYIIAEMSANHNGDISNAFKIIDMAKSSGADCVKLQTYTPDTLTIDSKLPDFQLTEGLWGGQSLYELYKDAFMPWEWHQPLFDYAKKIGITIFSSPFDNTAVDLLEDLNTPAYKIASFEAVDLPLIKYVAQTGKPMIISTGMADAEEIQEAIEAARDGGCKELAILHCVSGYPAPAGDYNLRTLVDMQEKFGLVTGLSDYTTSNLACFGAVFFEKHFTLDNNLAGPDHWFSENPESLKDWVESIHQSYQMMGDALVRPTSKELEMRKLARRSIVILKDTKQGDKLTEENIGLRRAGNGLAPIFIKDMLGSFASQDLVEGNLLELKNVQ